MTTYNKKCKGCGSMLNDEKGTNGYVPKFDPQKTVYCYRCFRMKHYGENNIDENIRQNIQSTIDALDFNKKKVFLVIDALNIPSSIIKLNDTAKDVVVIVNKMDLFARDSNFNKMYEAISSNLDYYGVKYNEIIFASAKSKTSLKLIDDEIKNLYKVNKKAIFVGKSNVGKSSIINGILKLHDKSDILITNNSINTTININQIKIERNYLIDTPGFISDDNILNYIKHKDSKKIVTDKIIKPKVYQIKYKKNLIVENLLSIRVKPQQDNGSVVFYSNFNWDILSTKSNAEQKLNQNTKINLTSDKNDLVIRDFVFNQDKNTICIAGLGMLVFKGISEASVLTNKCIGIELLKHNIS